MPVHSIPLEETKQKKKAWRPSALPSVLRARSDFLHRIRQFFFARGFIEVETPLLSQHTVTDCHINSFSTTSSPPRFLQTSPEYAMKRLLAAGSGPIFQLCKAFRQEEQGRKHNPEFTLLEWYRPHWSHDELMEEIDTLLVTVAQQEPATRTTYQALFQRHCGFDPFAVSLDVLRTELAPFFWNNADQLSESDRDTALQFLFSQKIEPHLGHSAPVFVYDYPASQAALAKISTENPLIAERFELFLHGTEIANGFHELTDPQEQSLRFHRDQRQRQQQQKTAVTIDPLFMAALEEGLPPCAGVALGIDRLLMCVLQKEDIREVLSFDWQRA